MDAFGRIKPVQSLDGIKPVRLAPIVHTHKATIPLVGHWSYVVSFLT